ERWLSAPTLDLPEIIRRQTTVGELLAQPSDLNHLRELLQQVRDIPRILSRLQNRLRNPRELGGVKDTLTQIPAIMACLDLLDSHLVGSNGGEVARLRQRLTDLPDLRALLDKALADELPND